MKKDDRGTDEWDFSASPQQYDKNEKPSQNSDVETMKEKFAKLLLGEDITGGTKGVSAALALSNAITNLGGILPDRIIFYACFELPLYADLRTLKFYDLICSIRFWWALEVGTAAGGKKEQVAKRNELVAIPN